MLPLFRRLFSLMLCGLLFANSSFCYNLLGNDMAKAASSGSEAAPSETTSGEFRSPQEIAVPPIIREAPIDLQNALPDDFVVSRQTPYSSGRNEVLIVSPSTGTEQRFEINLPGASGSFRLYQASFDKVVIDDPARVMGDGSSLSSDQVQAKLEKFTINFDSNNLPVSVILADGVKAEFSGSEAIIRSADGQVIETIVLQSVSLSNNYSASAKSSAMSVAQANSNCEGQIRNEIYAAGQNVGSRSNALRNAQSDEGKAISWATTYGKHALEDSLVASTRNQTLQEIACKPPVQCEEPQDYEGQSEIRTDLFQLSGGKSPQVNIRYEFYEIPDRMEIYYEGEMIDSIPKGGGDISGSSIQLVNLPSGASYVGVKLIGNEDENTRWNYTISCIDSSPEAEVAKVPEEDPEPQDAESLNDYGPDNYGDDYSPCTSNLQSASAHRRLLSQEFPESVKESMETNQVSPQGLINETVVTVTPSSNPGASADYRQPADIFYDDFQTTVRMPEGLSPQDIFQDMRRGLDTVGRGTPCNDFRSTATFEHWRSVDGSNGYGQTAGSEICNAPSEGQFSNSPVAGLGDIYSINIKGPDNGNVIVAEIHESNEASRIRYATLDAGHGRGRRNNHPNRGSREYGFEANPDGSTTFYSRGVDQWRNPIAQAGNSIFSPTPQQQFWLDFLDGIGERVKLAGGSVISEADFSEFVGQGLPNCFKSGGYPTVD
ncbi:MAG: hypothetical protein AAFY72_07940 [Cyanobacteria bacterium J06649_4]